MAYLIFDLPHENDSKGIHIPAASLKLSKLDNARKLFLCVEAGSSVLLPEDISPSEMLRTHQMLTALNAVLLNELAKASIAAGGTVRDEATYKIMSALSSEDRIRLIEAGVSLAGLFLLLKEELEHE